MNEPKCALFICSPVEAGELKQANSGLVVQKKPYYIEKIIDIPKIEYGNFITDMFVDRWFIEENADLCRIDNNGVWHCILVQLKGGRDGVLVMSDGCSFPKWAAFLQSEEVSN